MLQITFLTGKPASGKTYIAKTIFQMFPKPRKIYLYGNNKSDIKKAFGKYQQNYDLVVIDEARLCNAKSIIKLYDNYCTMHYDYTLQIEIDVLKSDFNVIICSQDNQIYQKFTDYLSQDFTPLRNNSFNVQYVHCEHTHNPF
jgi:hypothetical protein